MGLLSEDIDVVTSKICANVHVRVTSSPVAALVYRGSAQRVADILKTTLSQVPIDEICEEVITMHCLRVIDLPYRHVFRFYRPGDPGRTCADPEVYEFKCKLTKYTKPFGFYIRFI